MSSISAFTQYCHSKLSCFQNFSMENFMYFSFTSLYPLSTHWASFLRTFLPFFFFFPIPRKVLPYSVTENNWGLQQWQLHNASSWECSWFSYKSLLNLRFLTQEIECTGVQISETQKSGGRKIAFREKKRVETKPMVQTSSPLSLG